MSKFLAIYLLMTVAFISAALLIVIQEPPMPPDIALHLPIIYPPWPKVKKHKDIATLSLVPHKDIATLSLAPWKPIPSCKQGEKLALDATGLPISCVVDCDQVNVVDEIANCVDKI